MQPWNMLREVSEESHKLWTPRSAQILRIPSNLRLVGVVACLRLFIRPKAQIFVSDRSLKLSKALMLKERCTVFKVRQAGDFGCEQIFRCHPRYILASQVKANQPGGPQDDFTGI